MSLTIPLRAVLSCFGVVGGCQVRLVHLGSVKAAFLVFFFSNNVSCIMIVSFGLNTVGQEDEKELKATHALSESHNLIQEAEIISAKLMPWGEP